MHSKYNQEATVYAVYVCTLHKLWCSTGGPLYKGHIGIRYKLSTVERLSTLQRWKCISTIGKSTFGALESVLCREVISMVSFNRGSTVQ